MPSVDIGVVIMVGDAGASPQEQLVLAAQRASALDLIAILHGQGIERIIVAAPTVDWIPADLNVISDQDMPNIPFHFGERLARLIERYDLDPVLYFGGGSAPLVDASVSNLLVSLIDRASRPDKGNLPSHIVLTNNLHSSDWAAISQSAEALPVIRQASRDNSLAWMLRESGEYDVRVLSGVRPATSMDLDTPSDLAILVHHPDTQPYLQRVIDDERLRRIPIETMLKVVSGEARTLALIGRVSPLAWNAFNKVARCWTRVIAEERGMVASGRQDRGEVRSVLTPWIKVRGLDSFFHELADMADAVLFDNRVLFAAMGIRPDAADRFASDLFWIDTIRDPWLQEFTQAAANAPLPVILGGHSLVAGGLYALAEIIEYNARKKYS